jgi:2-haloacid dehalogenase
MPDRWLTFDCFGTLVDWHTGFTAILRPVLGNDTARLINAYHKYERQVESERPHRLYRDVLVTSLLRAARELDLPLSEADALRLPDQWRSLPVFPDVPAALAVLRGAGCKLGVLTNCDDDLFAQTQKALGVKLDFVVTAERVRDYKPSLSHFRYFSRVSGADHSLWTHVACSLFHDLEPAAQLGLRRFWIDRDKTGENPGPGVIRLTSAAELAQALAL